MKKRNCILLITGLLALLLCAFSVSAQSTEKDPEPDPAAEQQTEAALTISMPAYGVIRFEGAFSAGDRIRLYQREYRSAEQAIIEMLLVDTCDLFLYKSLKR